MASLALYHYQGCYFCTVVRRAAEKLQIDLELRDIHRDRSRHDELVAARGRRTVPVLRIETDDGNVEWLGESRSIVFYLDRLAAA